MLTRKPYLAILQALYRAEALACCKGEKEDLALIRQGRAAFDTLSVQYTRADLAEYQAERAALVESLPSKEVA